MHKRNLKAYVIFLLFLFFVALLSTYIIDPNQTLKYIYSTEQKLIPVFFMYPKDRISGYINNANALFKLAIKETDPKKSVDMAFRAEHSMTLSVGELRRLDDTSTISYSFLYDTYVSQKKMVNILLNRVDGDDKKNISLIVDFLNQNEKTSKTIFYNNLSPKSEISY